MFLVNEDVEALTNYEGTKSLASHIENETGFEVDDEFAVGIDIETNDEDLNARDPRIVHLPIKPAGVGDISTIGPESEAVPSQPEFSIDNGGVVMSLTVQVEGERTPATLMGMTRTKSQSNSLLRKNSEEVDTKTFIVENESAKTHRERTDQQLLKDDWQSEFESDTPTVSPTDTRFTCWGCTSVVGLACAGVTNDCSYLE